MLQNTGPPYNETDKKEKRSEKEQFSDIRHTVLHVGRYQ